MKKIKEFEKTFDKLNKDNKDKVVNLIKKLKKEQKVLEMKIINENDATKNNLN